MEEGARTVCWKPIWHPRVPDAGLEHCRVAHGRADAVVLAFDDDGLPFRLQYALTWDTVWHVRSATLRVAHDAGDRTLALVADGAGAWHDGDGRPLPSLEGCLDIDIWPTPFTNTFPMRREPFALGERRVFRMAWISAPDLAVRPMQQAYTRLADGRWRFESLDGSGFVAELTVDADGLVIDYPGAFARVAPARMTHRRGTAS